MEEIDEPPKPLIPIDRSLEELRDLPKEVQHTAGFNLDLVQRGKKPSDWKPLRNVGRGVREIRIWEESGTYRVIYVANLKDAVYLLGAFKKTTQKTEKADLALIKHRFKQIGKR